MGTYGYPMFNALCGKGSRSTLLSLRGSKSYHGDGEVEFPIRMWLVNWTHEGKIMFYRDYDLNCFTIVMTIWNLHVFVSLGENDKFIIVSYADATLIL